MKYGGIMLQARTDSGKSRDYVAEKMGITYKTVWSWENSISEPQISQFFEFFNVIGINVKSYINKCLNYDDIRDYTSADEAQITADLHKEIDSYTYRRKSLLHFILLGSHGADMDAELNKEVAHLQTDWHGRVTNTVLELSNYRLGKSKKEFPVYPNTELVHNASIQASKCIIEGRDGYIVEKRYKEESEETKGMLDI